MSGLCGMPYEDGDDYSTLWREGKHRARIEHVCEDCGCTIPVGEEYGKATALYDGEWTDWKRCAACLLLAEMVATVTGACPLWGGLSESVGYANEYERAGKKPLPDPSENRRMWEAAGKGAK